MNATTGRFRRFARTAALNGVLVALALALSAGLAEVAIRVAAPQQLILIRPDVWQPADTIGWQRRPNVDVEVNTGERTVRLRTDPLGFRIGADGPPGGGAGIFLIGDSFMEALQVEYEESLAGLLQRDLPPLTGQPVAVRNAAIGGWGPSHYFLQARSLLARDTYRLVIATLFVGNDAQGARMDYVPPRTPVERHEFRFPRRLAWEEVVNAWLRPINDGLETQSHLFVMVRNRLQTLRMRAGVSALYFPKEFLKSEVDAPRWTITAEICRDLRDLAAQHGARTIVVLIPERFQIDRMQFETYLKGFGVDSTTVDLDQPSRRLQEELTRRGLTVIDALPAFRAAFAAGERLYGTVDPHLNAQGHSRLAEVVVPLAAEMLRAPAPTNVPRPPERTR